MALEAKESDPYFPDDDELPPKQEPKKKHSTPDGPRYVVGVQSDTDSYCYSDFFETEQLTLAKEKAEEIVAKKNKAVIIWDRMLYFIIHRYTPPPKKDEPVAEKKCPKSIKRK